MTTEAPIEESVRQKEFYEQPNYYEPYRHDYGYSYYPNYYSSPFAYTQTIYLKDDNDFGSWKLFFILLTVPIAIFIFWAIAISFVNVAARAGIQQQQQQQQSSSNSNNNANANSNNNALTLYVNATGRSFDTPSFLTKSPKWLGNFLL